MKRTLFYGITALIVLGLSMCKGPEKQDNSQKEQSVKPTVKTMTVQQKVVSKEISFAGNLLAGKETHLAPATAGRIDKIYVEVGDHVSAGQVLVEMDKTQLTQAKINYESLLKELQRLDTLKNIGSVSEQNYDQIKTQLDVARTNYEFLLENVQLKAPFSGIITGKYYNEGEMFGMSPNPAIGKAAIVSLMKLNPLKMNVSMSESYFPLVNKGQKAVITSDLYPEDTFQAHVSVKYPVVDNLSKTFTVELLIDNPDEKLRPGMFVKATLQFGIKNTIVVPSIAVLKQTGTNNRYVFVVENNKAVRKFVTLGQVFDDELEILSGLKPGEKLVVAGQNKLSDQIEVQIVN